MLENGAAYECAHCGAVQLKRRRHMYMCPNCSGGDIPHCEECFESAWDFEYLVESWEDVWYDDDDYDYSENSISA